MLGPLGARPDEAVSWGKVRADAMPVKVYADAVINHMAAGAGTGTAGTSYGSRSTKDYTPDDFVKAVLSGPSS